MPKKQRKLVPVPTMDTQPPAAAATNQLRVHIRWMIRRDMYKVLAIERSAFEVPWLEEEFVRCLRRRNTIGMVAESQERVVGFMIYELHKQKLRVLNFAVAEGDRRRGVGRQMIDKLISKLGGQRRTRITLEVRESNLTAQLFFRAAGFKAVAVLRDWYDDAEEDAYQMQYRITPDDDADLVLPLDRHSRFDG